MRIVYIGLMIFSFISCSKNDNLPIDNRCSTQIINNPKILILTSQEIDTIKYLFNKNHIDSTNLQFSFYTYFRGYNNVIFRNISAYQYLNGLKVFTDYLAFEFGANDSLIHQDGYKITNLSLSNKPKLSLAQVRLIFINAMKNDGFYKNNYAIQDSCIDMEFGYYDLNSGSGNQVKNYTSAWKVYPQNREYPIAYIDDLHKKLIYYFNGVLTKK